MARLTDVTFTYNGSKYSLLLDFDDSAIMEDTIAFDVVAKRSGGKFEELTLSARVEIIPRDREIVVYAAGQEIARLDGFNTRETDIEELFQKLPTEFMIDPVTGCAIKAGLSAIIGQAVACFRSLEANVLWAEFKEYLGCMAGNFSSISKTAMFRAFKCIWKLGSA